MSVLNSVDTSFSEECFQPLVNNYTATAQEVTDYEYIKYCHSKRLQRLLFITEHAAHLHESSSADINMVTLHENKALKHYKCTIVQTRPAERSLPFQENRRTSIQVC